MLISTITEEHESVKNRRRGPNDDVFMPHFDCEVILNFHAFLFVLPFFIFPTNNPREDSIYTPKIDMISYMRGIDILIRRLFITLCLDFLKKNNTLETTAINPLLFESRGINHG
jgi:hypothetical protein